ncbi:MAG: hypothetical protein NXH75_13950, partial [Halobacteriovoraceae bacterium]|nr:hypothetical protein [Halobacteriovoraceae bacterium]
EVGAGDWELIVEQQSKWDTEDTEVPFAVVITVSDPRRDSSVDIYNSIQSETQNRYTEEVQGTIRVR